MGKDLEGSSHCLINALSRYLPEGEGLSKTMKDHREMTDDSAEMRTGHIPKTNIYSCTILRLT
jgi:hypothetical protein